MNKASIVVPDFGGLQSLAAPELIKAQHYAHALLRQNKACIVQHGAEGPDALQVLIKAPMVLPDHCLPREGRAPLSHKSVSPYNKEKKWDGTEAIPP